MYANISLCLLHSKITKEVPCNVNENTCAGLLPAAQYCSFLFMPIRRKTLLHQSINQSINQSITFCFDHCEEVSFQIFRILTSYIVVSLFLSTHMHDSVGILLSLCRQVHDSAGILLSLSTHVHDSADLLIAAPIPIKRKLLTLPKLDTCITV